VLNNSVKVKPPEEAFYVDTKAGSIEENFQNLGLDKEPDPTDHKRQDDDANLDEDEDIATLVDIKRWKYRGQYINRFLDTCPQPLTIDCRNDRPFEEADYVSGHGLLRQTKKHISEQSKAYLNRVDTYRINEELREIEVIDDFGISIMYDASIMDMITFEQELAQIGTHFIKKTELDFDFEKFEYGLIDRVEVLYDLMEYESKYQFLKAQVVLAYLDALEHSCDILAQQRLMQVIVDIMAWRPRLDLQRSWYFAQSYRAEINYLEALLKLIQTAIHFQMSNEKKENQQIRDYLNLSFKMADNYKQMTWTDVDSSKISDEVKERQYLQGGQREGQPLDEVEQKKDKAEEKVEKPITIESKSDDQQSAQSAAPAEGKKTFVEELGFQAPDIKEQMQSQSSNDALVEDYIDRDASFIKSQEGYPSFFRSTADRLSQVTFCNGTDQYRCQPFGVLDFYDSLQIMPNVHAQILQGQAELKKDLCPAGAV